MAYSVPSQCILLSGVKYIDLGTKLNFRPRALWFVGCVCLYMICMFVFKSVLDEDI